MRVILIDPALRRVTDIELADKRLLAEMRRIIGCKDLDHSKIASYRQGIDQLWSDDGVFARGQPCFAFRIVNKRRGVAMGPFGGKCIIIGVDRHGNECPPGIPMIMLENDIDWLDSIVPTVVWTTEEVEIAPGVKAHRFNSTVVYSRPQS